MDKTEKIINKLKICEDIQLNNFRAEREKIYGMQEGYQLAMEQAKQVIQEYMETEAKDE